MLGNKVIYTDDLPSWKGGVCEYPKLPWGDCTIKIRLKYQNDDGIVAHEMEHYKQWKKLNVLHLLFKKLSKEYHLSCELDAYCKQVQKYGYSSMKQAEWIVDALHTKYNLNMDYLYIYQRCKDKFGLGD
jgi:hypothetical protein